MSLKHLEAGSKCPKLDKGTLRLYSMKYCPHAQRSRLVLLAKNIPHEIVNINLHNEPEWFYPEKTPVGAVPVLEHDDGRILYESLIICDYLDSIYPEHRLNPTDPFIKAKHQIMIETFSNVTTAFYKLMRKDENAVDEMNSALEYFEKNLTGNFFGNEKVAMMIDYMIWPWFERMPPLKEFSGFELDSQKFPKLASWIERMKHLPAVHEIMTKPEIFSKFYKGYFSGAVMEYDIEE